MIRPILALLLLWAAAVPAQDGVPIQARPAPAAAEEWDQMILTIPGLRRVLPSTLPEETTTNPALTLAETRITEELLEAGNRELRMPAELYRKHLSAGHALLSSNLVYQASREFWMAHRVSPGSEEAAAGLALCLLLSRDSAGAIRMYEWLATVHPANPGHRLNLAAAYHQAGRHDAAITELRRLLRDRSGDPAVVHYNLAMNLQAAGDPRAALDALRAAAELRPADPANWMAAARVCARSGWEEEMLAALRRARETAPAKDYEEWLKHPAFATTLPAIRAAGLHRGAAAQPAPPPPP